MARRGKVDRGIHEYPKGSGNVFIEYTNAERTRRPETIGRCVEPRCSTHGSPADEGPLKCKVLARTMATYRSRKAEARRLRANPQPTTTRQTVLLTDILKACLKRSMAAKITWRGDLHGRDEGGR